MARLTVITERDSLAEADRPIFDAIVEGIGVLGAPYRLLLNKPEVAAKAAEIGAYIRQTKSITAAQREIGILIAAREADCQQIWSAHLGGGRRAGVSEASLDAIGHRGALDGLPAEEAPLIAYGRELLRDHRVSDETYAATHALCGDDGMLDLTVTICFYTMAAGVLNAFEFEPPAGAAELP